MSEVKENQLISAGTPADNASIDVLETIAVVSVAGGIISIFLTVWPAVAAAAAAAALTGYGAIRMRHERLLENEQAAREALLARYGYPLERRVTIEGLEAPTDVKGVALELVGKSSMSQAEITARLTLRVGAKRANDYLPLILQQADRSVEWPTDSSEAGSDS